MKKLILLPLSLVAISCAATSGDAVSKSISNINEELVIVQKSITDNQMSIEDLKTNSATTSADIVANTDAIAELRSEIAYLSNEIMILKSGGALPEDSNVLNKPAGNISDAQKSKDQQIIIIEDSSAAKNSIYSYAIELKRQRKYTESREKFQEFINKYPNDELAGNAQYWIGETYYSVDDMKNALSSFELVITKYPKSQKVPDAMLKIGYVYYNTGKKDSAVNELKSLVKKYPKSKSATLAKEKLKSWGA